MNKWVINKPDNDKASELAQQCDLTPLCIKTLMSRGLSDIDSLSAFFEETELEDPFMLKDMQIAVDTINKAIDCFDRICVYGDYDCDGVTSTAMLYSYLECSGANVMYYIPERSEGYGMNEKAVQMLAEQGVKLIITVDNGISAVNEAKLIAQLGIKLVITDHHQPSEELPEAVAIVNPHRVDCPSAFKELSGVGVALKLCAALDGGSYDAVLEQYGDIVAIGTVADVVSLKGENRTIVQNGLRLLKNTENSGLVRLMEKSSLTSERITSTALAFMLAPRINAAGRFGSPKTAVQLLLAEDDEAEIIVEELAELNTRRKSCEEQIISEIKNTINSNPTILTEKVIVIDGKNWHHGVIGIVASKVMETYGKPCVIISVDENGEARGSARSIKGFSIFKCFSYCADILDRFGGHECAGGLSLSADKIPQLRKMIAEYADTIERMPYCEIHADKMLTREDLTVGQIESLKCIEPCGEGNPQPVFAVIGAKVQKVIALSQGRHTRLEVAYDSTVQTVIAFGKSPEKLGIYTGDTVDMLVTAEINEYQGRRSISLRLRDIRLSGINQQKALSAIDCYDSFIRGEKLSDKIKSLMIPKREDFLAVYKTLGVHKTISLEMLMCRMFALGINFAKTHICVDAFCQTGLAVYDAGERLVSVLPVDKDKKVELSQAPVMKALCR